VPINFVTGLPRQGKTLFTFIQIQERAKKENRPVFYCNIPEVTLPGWTEIDHPDKWMECPNDSIIVVDELQDFWGAASSGARVPMPILELSKHGKRGIDFYFITQDPTLVHNTPRKLCETHWHVVRAFGSENAVAYKHRGMQTDPSKVAHKAEKYPWRYPKEAFGKKDKAGNWIAKPWYKSADVHNVQRKIPLKVWAIPVAIMVAIGSGWFAVSSILSYGSKMANTAAAAAGVPSDTAGSSAVARPPGAPGVSGPGVRAPLSTDEWLALRVERIKGLPQTMPIYDDVTRPTVAPYPAACVHMSGTCKCYTQQATLMQVPGELCLQVVKHGYFVDWRQEQQGQHAPRPEPVRREPVAPAQAPVQVVVQAPSDQPVQPGSVWSEGLAARNAQVRSWVGR